MVVCQERNEAGKTFAGLIPLRSGHRESGEKGPEAGETVEG